MTSSADRHVAAYDIVRALAMLLVIAGHSSYYFIMTPIGGIDYFRFLHDAGLADTALHAWTDWVASGIYTFHMRIFFALSGAVFYLRLRQGAYDGVAAFLKKKAHRLLVPYVLATAFFAVPVKYLAGYWTGDAHLVRDIVLGQFLLLGNSHLWFLVVLFGAFVIVGWGVLTHPRIRAWLLEEHSWRVEAALGVAILVLLLADGTVGHLVQDRIHRMMQANIWWQLLEAPAANLCTLGWSTLWMITGMRLEHWRERLAGRKLSAVLLVVLCVLCLAVLCGGYRWESHWQLPPGKGPVIFDELVHLGLAIAGVTMTWGLGFLLAHTRAVRMQWIQALSRDSMGIYLYSDPLNYAILALFAAACGPAAFGSTSGSASLVALRFFGTLFGGWAVTLLVRRISVRLRTGF